MKESDKLFKPFEISGIDLFAGCGGLSLGFQNAGFNIIAAFDNWEPAIKVYQNNFPHEAFLCDIESLDKDFKIFKELNPEIIIGGPPCQDFSSAGKRNEYLGRGNLTIVFAEIIATVKPKWFVMENVDRAAKSDTYKITRKIFKDAGYGISEKILDASLCRVPQKRKRFFCVGELEGEDKKIEPYFEANLAKHPMTVREYFRDYLGENLGIQHYYRHPRSYRRRGVFSIDEPSPTVRGVNRPIPKTYKNHPGDSTFISSNLRPLSTLERSYIQTFPRNFIFEGSKTDLEQMIGNAVPVKLAEYVARCLLQYIQERHCNSLKTSGDQAIKSDEQAIQLCLPF